MSLPPAAFTRRTVSATALAVALSTSLTLIPAGADAGRTTRAKLPTAAQARHMPGRAGRCARGSLRLHSSFAQYGLCLRDGRLRVGHRPSTPSPAPAKTLAPITLTTPTPTPPAVTTPPATSVPVTKLTAAVYGDAPYGTTPTDTSEFDATPNFIAAVNQDPAVQLVLHVGDIHSGKQYCTAAYDQSIADLWTGFDDPLVFTPGDNEWTDCHKAAEGGGSYNASTGKVDYATDGSGNLVDYAGGDPAANLELVRRRFFAHPGMSLGAHPMTVTSQADAADPAHPSDRDYAENAIWEQAGVLFVTVNLPGGSNNDTDPWYGAPTMSPAQQAEVSARTGADLRWIAKAFATARADGVAAVVVDWQADIWDLDGKTAAHLSQYDQFASAVADGTTAFGKPVLMLNGDSHVYKTDNPLAASDPANAIHPGHDVPNFHRIVVHGSTTPLEYLRLSIDTTKTNTTTDSSFGPFSWERVIR